VLQEWRGTGIGSALLDAVDTEFKRLGVRAVIVGVLPGNEGAVLCTNGEGSSRRGSICRGSTADPDAGDRGPRP
jgi:L-amino acid N-acyltransferase YncA